MYYGLALVLALAACAAGSGYIPGREYVYRYYGYMYSGFSDRKAQYAGMAFDSHVTVQNHGDHFVFKLDDSKYDIVNTEIEDFTDHHYNFRDLPEMGNEFLKRPFRVFFKNGQVHHFETSKGEPAVAVNIKRGFLSFFNLNFDATNASIDHEHDNELFKPEENAHYYKVYEDGVLGECETEYVIEHLPNPQTPDNNIVLNVTKSKNYHKCKVVPNHHYSTFYGHECGDADHEKSHTLHGNAYYYYNIRGDRHHYVIEKVRTEGEVIYVPYPLEGQPADLYTNRTLILLEERAADHEIAVTGEVDRHDHLRYEIPFRPLFKGDIDLHKPHYLFHIYNRKASSDEIKRIAETLVHVYDDDSYKQKTKDTNYPALFLELVKAFGTLSYEDIDELYHKYGDIDNPHEATGDQLRYRSLFYDVLVNSGTNPAILYAKNLIHNHKVTHGLTTYFLQQVHLHVKEVTEKLLDEIYDLCQDPYVKEDINSYAACYSSLSNIVYDSCNSGYHPEGGFPHDEYDCPDDIPEKYFNKIVDKFEHTDEEYLKVVYLKAIGNLGVKASIEHIRPYVEGHVDESEYLRNIAIWSLKNLGHNHPESVKQLLVPLYFNRSEHYEHRLAAFTIMLYLHPSTHELETIARALLREEDDQVRSYVYSTFKAYVNSTHPCDRHLSEDVRFALHVLRYHEHEFEKYDYSYSHHNYAAGYDKDYDYGGSTLFAYYANDNGYIPRTTFLGFNDFIGGKSFNSFGIGLKQYGLERFVDRLLGPGGAMGKHSIFDLFSKRQKRDISNVEKERREIEEKLHLETKKYEPIHGELFFKFMGNHLSFLYFNDSTFEEFFTKGAFSIPDLAAKYGHLPVFNYQRFLLAVDRMYFIPSEGGVPVLFDYKQPAYYYHKNNKLEIDVKPAFFRSDRDNKLPTELDVHVDGHFVFDKNLFATVGFVAPFEQAVFGCGINRRSTLSLPIKLEIDVHLDTAKVDLKWNPVVPHEIYHFHYEPYTFIDSYKKFVSVIDEPDHHYFPVRMESHRQRYYKKYFHDTLGLGIKAYKDYDNEYNDYGSWFRFLTEKDYREKFYYLYANPQLEPYHYDLVLEAADENPTTEVDATFRYDFSFDHGERQEQAHRGHDDFVEYQHDRPTTTFLESDIRAEVVLKGTKERKVKAEFLYSRDLPRKYHKISLYYDRTPFARHESEDLKLCVSGYLKYPDLDLKQVANLNTIELERTVESKVKIHFGKDCSTDKKITIQSKFEQSEEQKYLETHREEPDTVEHHNPYAHLYQDCLKEKKSGQQYPRSCIDYMHLSTNLYKYTFHVKHEHLTPRFLNNTYKLARLFKYKHHPYADHNTIDVSHPEDELHIEANYSAVLPVADIRITKPHSESHYTHVPTPCFHPVSAYPIFEDVRTKRSLNNHYCLLEGNHVHTFDQFNYELPEIDCYKVLAKDCSPGKKFIVLGTKITHPKYHKAIKVILGDHKVEALPVSDESDIIIRVDGKKVPVTETEPYFYNVEGRTTPLFYISHKGYFYSLHSEEYGLIVEYNGEFVSIQVSPYYRSKLCGLCGNYNGQTYDGYVNSKGCHLRDEASYAYSFTIPTDTCHVPEINEDCTDAGAHGCTHLHTHVVQLTTGKVPQTCFSTEPVPECTNGCVESGHVTRKIGYHCLPAKDESTKKLLRQQQTRILYEVSRKSRDHESDLEVPEGCHRQ